MRITQRVIFKFYLKYYNHPDNDIFIDNALDWKPDFFTSHGSNYIFASMRSRYFAVILGETIGKNEDCGMASNVEKSYFLWRSVIVNSWINKRSWKTNAPFEITKSEQMKFQSQQFQFTKKPKIHSKYLLSAWEWWGCGTRRKKYQIFC